MKILFRSIIGLSYFGFLILIRHYSGFEYAVLAGICIVIMNEFDLKENK